jgi:hypothetical protein
MKWLVVVLVVLPLELQAADVVGLNGTIRSVPGYPGATLNYRVDAVKTGDSAEKTAHSWFKLMNPNAFEIKVVLCAMLTLHNGFSLQGQDGQMI